MWIWPGFEFRVALRFLREGRMQTVLIIVGVAAGVAVIAYGNADQVTSYPTHSHLNAKWPAKILCFAPQGLFREPLSPLRTLTGAPVPAGALGQGRCWPVPRP